MTTKIHFTVNAIGKFCRGLIGPGNESDFKKAGNLIKDYKPLIGMGDKGYDADWVIDAFAKAGAVEIAIPPKSNRKVKRDFDKAIYKGRNVVERAINKIKFFRRVATRYDKLGRNFLSFVLIAATLINLR